MGDYILLYLSLNLFRERVGEMSVKSFDIFLLWQPWHGIEQIIKTLLRQHCLKI